MHKHGIIHRDLKPTNLMIVKDSENPEEHQLKIIDFGLSCHISDANPRIICGTPGYLAPEVLFHKPCDFKCDVFSVGCILHQMLTGKLVFRAHNQNEMLKVNKKCDL